MINEHAIEDVDLNRTEHDHREIRPNIPSINIEIYPEAFESGIDTKEDLT